MIFIPFWITPKLFRKLNNLILSGKLDGFGAISFNICHGYEDITAYMGGITGTSSATQDLLMPSVMGTGITTKPLFVRGYEE